ncbi:hypothetical protein LZ496_13740 [Sphingomonas sp. NSE70-1]|uniref:Uncharacterized protein n=1 Tax=Sphingomonas caseinilyticus TaxID=2908205 RepID=A0ABT0RXT9_9SPHN|nr:hypothetical protein [Sphingomonas caseinilyticus]MCL6699837.1 hypothetical protein [Sphingomonas caseinilyticus]
MNLLVLDKDLVDQKPDVGLTQRGVITSEPVAEHFAESADDLWRHRPLAGFQLPFQRFNIRSKRRDAPSM